MSHPAQMEFFDLVFSAMLPNQEKSIRVIDFGSLDINGGPHHLLSRVEHEYVGIDLAEGKNVTLAKPGELVDFQTASFDVAMSSELFEHTPMWREIFYNMCRLTKPGGIVIMSCAGRHRPEHGTSRSDKGFSAPFVVDQGVEYYRNVTALDISRSLALENWFERFGIYENPNSFDTYLVGIRSGADKSRVEVFTLLLQFIDDKYKHLHFVSEGKYWLSQTYLWCKTHTRIFNYRIKKIFRIILKFN